MNDIVIKYEIRGADGNYIQAGETEDREHIQVVITEISAEKHRLVAATILLTKQQWYKFCGTKYHLSVNDAPEEVGDE